VCAAGKCGAKDRPDSADCSRNTDGASCGSTTCGGISCSYANSCSTSGTGSQTCTHYSCSGGSCGSWNSYGAPACNRSVTCAAGDSQSCQFVEHGCAGSGGADCYCPGHQACASDCSGWGACVKNAGSICFF
jgi:hypothetical protein